MMAPPGQRWNYVIRIELNFGHIPQRIPTIDQIFTQGQWPMCWGARNYRRWFFAKYTYSLTYATNASLYLRKLKTYYLNLAIFKN